MLEGYDQDDLLDYIEDRLDVDRARSLRAQIEADPDVAELIEAMRSDRAMLMSDPEPRLPVDFAAELEPMLVRPMLIDAFEASAPAGDSRPGRERRRQRRARRLQNARRLALAAAIGLVTVGGIWAAVVSFELPVGPQEARVDEASEQPAPVPPHYQASLDAWGDEAATVHHYLPLTGVADGQSAHADANTSNDSSAEAGAVVADLLLVVRCEDAAAAEQMMAKAAETLDDRVALVQNFSYEEAKRLEQAWLAAGNTQERRRHAVASAGEEAVASGTNEAVRQLAERAQRQHRAETEFETSRQLLGEAEMAADFAEQLALSQHGATHTVSLPANQVQQFLATLAKADGYITSLKQLGDQADAIADAGAAFRDRAAVQQRLRQLMALGDDTIVHLAVRVVAE